MSLTLPRMLAALPFQAGANVGLVWLTMRLLDCVGQRLSCLWLNVFCFWSTGQPAAMISHTGQAGISAWWGGGWTATFSNSYVHWILLISSTFQKWAEQSRTIPCRLSKGYAWSWVMGPTLSLSWVSSLPPWRLWYVLPWLLNMVLQYDWKTAEDILLRLPHAASFATLSANVLLLSAPEQLLEGNFALFCSYTLGFRNDFQNILLVIMVRQHANIVERPTEGNRVILFWQHSIY